MKLSIFEEMYSNYISPTEKYANCRKKAPIIEIKNTNPIVFNVDKFFFLGDQFFRFFFEYLYKKTKIKIPAMLPNNSLS